MTRSDSSFTVLETKDKDTKVKVPVKVSGTVKRLGNGGHVMVPGSWEHYTVEVTVINENKPTVTKEA